MLLTVRWLTSNKFYSIAALRRVTKINPTSHSEPRLFARKVKKRLQVRRAALTPKSECTTAPLPGLITSESVSFFVNIPSASQPCMCKSASWDSVPRSLPRGSEVLEPTKVIHMSAHISTGQCLGTQRLMNCWVSEEGFPGGNEDLR